MYDSWGGLPCGGETLLSKQRGRQGRCVSHSSSWCTKVGVRRPGTLVRRGAGGVWAMGRVTLLRRRTLCASARSSSHDTPLLLLCGGDGSRSRPSEMTASPGDGGTESSTDIDGTLLWYVFFLYTTTTILFLLKKKAGKPSSTLIWPF